MGTEPVRSLELVDSERFNRLITVLQKTLERKDIVEQATASPAEQDYVLSYHDVTKSVKKKSPLAGLDVINYLKVVPESQVDLSDFYGFWSVGRYSKNKFPC